VVLSTCVSLGITAVGMCHVGRVAEALGKVHAHLLRHTRHAQLPSSVAMLESGDFFGEACIAGQLLCSATATTMDSATIVRIDRVTMNRVLQNEPAFSELFMSHLVSRNVRIQDDLVDQLFNSAEKRLARTLLLLAHFGEDDKPESVIPKISQETLAEMVGTTRSRISFFMNRFKKLGFIEYNSGLQVHRSLLNVVLSA